MRTVALLTAAALLATLAPPAQAAATFACKGAVAATGYKRPSEAQALSTAMARWVQLVTAAHGTSWAKLSRAQGKTQRCRDKNGIWQCRFGARPCGPVAPQRISPHRNHGAGLRPLIAN